MGDGHAVIHAVDVEPDLVDQRRVGEFDQEHLGGGGLQYQGGGPDRLFQNGLYLSGLLGQADADAQPYPGDGV